MPKKVEDPGCPFWMLTFGDCMSLLLTFFVMLMTFSTMNVSKLMDVMGGIQGALGMTNPAYQANKEIRLTPETKDPVREGELLAPKAEKTYVESARVSQINLRSLLVHNKFNEYKRQITRLGFGNFITTEQLDEGVAVAISADKLFAKNSAELRDEAPYLLQGFINIARSVGNELRIGVHYHLAGYGADLFNSPAAMLARQRCETLGNLLMGKYQIDQTRLGYSIAPLPTDKPEYVGLLLVEKLGISAVDLSEITEE